MCNTKLKHQWYYAHYLLQGVQLVLITLDCAVTELEGCGEESRIIDVVIIVVNTSVGTLVPVRTYAGRAGIVEFDMSIRVRCSDGFYGSECNTFCRNFESCEMCELPCLDGEFCQVPVGGERCREEVTTSSTTTITTTSPPSVLTPTLLGGVLGGSLGGALVVTLIILVTIQCACLYRGRKRLGK